MSLSPLYGSPVRPVAGTVTKERARVPAAPVAADVQEGRVASVDTTRAPPRVEELTVDAARALSVETINLLVKENPVLVGRLVTDAGKRRRGELPTPMTSIRPAARAILLCGELRRGHQLNDADRGF